MKALTPHDTFKFSFIIMRVFVGSLAYFDKIINLLAALVAEMRKILFQLSSPNCSYGDRNKNFCKQF